MRSRKAAGTEAGAKRPYQLRASTVAMVQRLLLDRALSAADVRRGMDYAEAQGARTTLACYVLAMSRILFTDAQLAAGTRFDPGTAAPPAGGTRHGEAGE